METVNNSELKNIKNPEIYFKDQTVIYNLFRC